MEQTKSNRVGYKHTEETKRKISLANSVALKGKKQSKETVEKRSKSMKGKNTYERSNETKKRMSDAHIGKTLSKAHKQKISEAGMGHTVSEETKRKQSTAKKGKRNPMHGVTGSKHHNWRNGASFEPYCHRFNEEFKEHIREKFNRTCFLCGKHELEQKGNRKLSVHHIDYNKDCLCNEDKCTFVPLCNSCHAKTNHNRNEWTKKILLKLNVMY